jgi:hypothetical protein
MYFVWSSVMYLRTRTHTPGLGGMEFARGDYRAAQRVFQSTLRLAPIDQSTRHPLDVCNQLLMLDPR